MDGDEFSTDEFIFQLNSVYENYAGINYNPKDPLKNNMYGLGKLPNVSIKTKDVLTRIGSFSISNSPIIYGNAVIFDEKHKAIIDLGFDMDDSDKLRTILIEQKQIRKK